MFVWILKRGLMLKVFFMELFFKYCIEIVKEKLWEKFLF